MAETLPPVVALLTANIDGFRKGMDEAKLKLHETGSGMSGLALSAVGVGVGLAAVGVGVAAVSLKMAGDFQQALTQIVTGAGESEKNIKMVGDGILKMAGDVGTGTKQLTDGFYQIASAGFHGADGLRVLQAAAEGAKVGNADLATVANGLTSALNAYNLPASEAAHVTSMMVATVASGKMHMQDLASVMGVILPTASALHIPFEQIMGALATMTTQGTDAATAGTSLRFLMASLAGPTSAAAKEFKALGVGESEIPGITASVSAELRNLGVHTSDVADVLAKGDLPGALQMITDAIGKKFPAGSAEYEAALKTAVGGTRGLTAALELTGGHMGIFRENIKTIAGATAEAGGHVRGWGLVQGDLNFQIDRFKAASEASAISLGTKLLPYATAALKWVNDSMPKWQAMVGVLMDELGPAFAAAGGFIKQFFAVGAQLSAWLQGPGLSAIRTFATEHKAQFQEIFRTAGEIMNGLRDLIMAVLSAIQAFWKAHGAQVIAIVEVAFTLVLEVVTTAMHLIRDVIRLVTDLIKGNWKGAWNDIKQIVVDAVVGIAKIAGDLLTLWGKAMDLLKDKAIEAVGRMKDGVLGILGALVGDAGAAAGRIGAAIYNGILGAVRGLGDALGKAVGGAIASLPGGGAIAAAIGGAGASIPRFAEGGVVPGPLGAPTLAIVHGGETVIPHGGGGAGRQLTIANTYHMTFSGSDQEQERKFRRMLDEHSRELATTWGAL